MAVKLPRIEIVETVDGTWAARLFVIGHNGGIPVREAVAFKDADEAFAWARRALGTWRGEYL